MIFRPFTSRLSTSSMPSSTVRRAAAALLLSAALALASAAPAHAGAGFSRPTADGFERSAPEGGILHFLLRLFGFAGGTMDPNGDPH